ncbi:hypothetical protein [Syntrophomonas erecta]
MYKDVVLIFYNRGLRSYIEVDLCAQCPRQDDKGCCGYYSPIFYPADFAYLLQNCPELLTEILKLPNTTILDASITINNTIDGNSYHCYFHRKEGGCRLPQMLRESICRHFVCPGIGWEKRPKLKEWKIFFEKLADYEIELNNYIADCLAEEGLSLRNPSQHPVLFKRLMEIFQQQTLVLPDFFFSVPPQDKVTITCEIHYKDEWPL